MYESRSAFNSSQSTTSADQHDPATELDELHPLTDTNKPRQCGIPESKPHVHWLSILALCASATCLALAIAVIRSNFLAWTLMYTGQIVVIGFLLSIMNLCLLQIAPVFFCQMEARFGPSVLQNYQAILRNSWMTEQASIAWRAILLILLLLLVGLSVAYKRFFDGEAVLQIRPRHPDYNSKFGVYAPPLTQPLGTYSGLSFALNATAPFSSASRANFSLMAVSTSDWTYSPQDEAELPAFPASMGISSLMLSRDSAAILDIPSPVWIHGIQNKTELGESWNVTASVWATVVSRNDSIDAHRHDDESSEFWQSYHPERRQTIGSSNMTSIVLLQSMLPDCDQTWTFVGIMPNNGNDAWDTTFSTFARNVDMFNTRRQRCTGTWTIARGGMQLVDGNCGAPTSTSDDNSPAPDVFKTCSPPSTFVLLQTFNENLGTFAGIRNQSAWRLPLTAMTVAAVRWSWATVSYGPGSTGWYNTEEIVPELRDSLLYDLKPTIYSQRTALRSSPLLFVVLAIQPVLSLVMLGLGVVFYSVPIGKGFNFIALLSGFAPESASHLRGAALSGRLTTSVQISISVRKSTEGEGIGSVIYSIPDADVSRVGSIVSGTEYK